MMWDKMAALNDKEFKDFNDIVQKRLKVKGEIEDHAENL